MRLVEQARVMCRSAGRGLACDALAVFAVMLNANTFRGWFKSKDGRAHRAYAAAEAAVKTSSSRILRGAVRARRPDGERDDVGAA